jgi:hypothetical protein
MIGVDDFSVAVMIGKSSLNFCAKWRFKCATAHPVGCGSPQVRASHVRSVAMCAAAHLARVKGFDGMEPEE